MRYSDECKMLASLAKRQLNSEKNLKKPDFETMKLSEIFDKLYEELAELRFELKVSDDFLEKETFHELGDVAACLVGILAYINHVLNTKKGKNV